MPVTVQELLQSAHAEVPKIDREAAEKMRDDGALMLDVRDTAEVAVTGIAEGAHHVSRGMLEFRADPSSPFHDPEFRRDRPVILYCASGGRAALAGKLLKDMGYAQVFNLGGLKDWSEAGGAVAHPLDQGM